MNVDIIAELGINHDGDFEKAVHMIDEVAATGVKIVKFQHYDPLTLLGPDSPYLDYASKCQFTKDQHWQLKQFCDKAGLEYLVSVFDIADIPWANSLCKRHKVASRMNQNPDFIKALRDTGKEVIMSVQIKPSFFVEDLRHMYCITKYPTPKEELMSLPCNEDLGLSSHCPSIEPSLLAILQGADLIEHHVTFDRTDEGCDHGSSITFMELEMLNSMANE